MEKDRLKIIDEFYEIKESDPSRARELIKKLNYKNDHNLLKKIAMAYLDEAQFDKSGNWRFYPDWRKLRMAERYVVKAFKIRPTCSLVLWILGKVRTAYSQDDVAIYCYQEIIKMGAKKISKSCCKLEYEDALAQVNDSRFQLYRLFYKTDSSKSKKYLAKYMKGLESGIWTKFEPLSAFICKDEDKLEKGNS